MAASSPDPAAAGPRADPRMFVLLHRALRADLERLVTALDRLPGGDRRRAGALTRWYRQVARQIHGHQRAEDEVFFPALASRSEEYAAGAGPQMTDDHRYVSALTDRVAERLRALARDGEPWADAWRAARAEASALAALARDHFALEERDVVPLFARHFSAAEYDALSLRADRLHPPSDLCFALPWFFDHLEAADRDAVNAETRAPMRLLAVALRPRYRRLVRAAGVAP